MTIHVIKMTLELHGSLGGHQGRDTCVEIPGEVSTLSALRVEIRSCNSVSPVPSQAEDELSKG